MLYNALLVVHFLGDVRGPETRKTSLWCNSVEYRKQLYRENFDSGDYNCIHLLELQINDETGETLIINKESKIRELKKPIEINPKKEKVGLDY